MEHIAVCDGCGDLLADLIEAPEAQKMDDPIGLKASTPAGQGDLLRLVHIATSRNQVVRRYWIAVAAAALVSVAIGGWWVVRTNSPQATSIMVARAYADQRTIELRFPNAPYGELKTQRGGGHSFVSASPLLLDAEIHIARGLQNQPENAGWLLNQAKVDLLHWNFSAARSALEQARQKDPQSLEIAIGLGISWFESAEEGGGAPDYGQAAELFSSVLSKQPNDAVALFNRALTYEKLQLPHQASRDWEQLLKLEPRGGWADEARTHLSALSRKLNSIETSPPARTLVDFEPGDPEVLELIRAVYSDSSQSRDPGHKDALHKAESLSQRFIAQNRDWWMQDLLVGLDKRPAPSAMSHLVRAAIAGQSGDAAANLGEASLALRDFQAANINAGILCARYQIQYALQRLFRAADCVHAGESLSQAAVRERFPWLYAQALHETASCSNMLSDFSSSETAARRSVETSKVHGFRSQRLRGIGILAETLTRIGDWREAWRLDSDGLGTFWSTPSPAMRAYQFYSDMAATAEAQESNYLAYSLIEEAVTQIDHTRNVTGRAMAHAKLGRLALTAQNSQEASLRFAEAETLFGGSDSVLSYRVDGEIGRARTQARQGDTAGAMSRLQAILDNAGRGKSIQAVLNNRVESVRLFRAKAEIERQAGNRAASEESLRRLVALAEEGLASLVTERDRLNWTHDLDQGYRGLVRAVLERGNPVEALNIWEWYRSAESGTSRGKNVGIPSGLAEKRYRTLNRSTMLTLVEMPEGTAAWTYDDRGMVYRWIPLRKERLEALTRDFLAACSDPKSSQLTLQNKGASLYALLIAPLVSGLESKRTLVVEPDGSLARIPFEALPTPTGRYFGEDFRIVISPGLYSFKQNSLSDESGEQRLVAVGAPQPAIGDAGSYPPLPDAVYEAHYVASLFPNHTFLSGRQATAEALSQVLAEATIFHFAGHSISSPSQAGLLLAGTNNSNGSTDTFWNARTLNPKLMARCRLAVLSACATGSMNGWGIADPDNLARALLAAGVRSVVASRWPVDSHATRLLMEGFYKHLMGHQTTSQALQAASAELRISRPHPYYWSAFSAFGNP
jgi:CHAT domain-containing protein